MVLSRSMNGMHGDMAFKISYSTSSLCFGNNLLFPCTVNMAYKKVVVTTGNDKKAKCGSLRCDASRGMVR